MKLEDHVVAHRSPEYEALVDLRRRVLRLPIGLDFTQAELDAEGGLTHFGLFDNGRAVACLCLQPLVEQAIKMRQVAVDPEAQGQGLGRRLVEISERWAASRGYKLMTLHAREASAGFYSRLRYTVVGEPFTEVGLPHLRMEKKLSPSLCRGQRARPRTQCLR